MLNTTSGAQMAVPANGETLRALIEKYTVRDA